MTSMETYFNELMTAGEAVPPELIPGYRNLFFAGAFAVLMATREVEQSTDDIAEMVKKFTVMHDEILAWSAALGDDDLTRH